MKNLVYLILTMKNKTEITKTDPTGNGNVVYTIEPIDQEGHNNVDFLKDCNIGDSICVDGVCLTVIRFTETEFEVGVATETFKKTDLQQWLKSGALVNLERAMLLNSRFGGHYVQGHVDGVAEIVGIDEDEKDKSKIYTFEFTRDDEKNELRLMDYIVMKGFICIDGVSLTVMKVDYNLNRFSIMMIVHTQENVIMKEKKIGDYVNIEVDVNGKNIARQVELFMKRTLAKDEESEEYKMMEKMVEKILAKKGY